MIIRNTTILDFATGARRGGVDVLVEDGRVRRIAPSGSASRGERLREPLPPGEPIDGSGQYLVPGLVNTHCHAAMTLLRGTAEDCTVEEWFNSHVWRYERALTPEDVYWGTLLAAAEMLLSGVTCVADHYFSMDQAFRAYEQAGMRADLAWAVFGTGDGWEKQFETALGFAADYRDRSPRITVSLGPHSPYICPESFLAATARKASDLGLKMHIHVSEEARQVRRSLEHEGRTPIKALDDTGVLRKGTVLAHAYHATDGDLALIADRGAGIAHCAKTYLKFGDVTDFLPRALAAGAAVGLGTDGPASNNTLNIFETARCAALLAKSATRDSRVARISEVLPLCHGGGRVLGMEDYGTVEEGSRADLVLIDPRTPSMSPDHDTRANVLYSMGERNVRTVIVDGVVRVRDGQLIGLDEEEIRARAAEISARLTHSAKGRPMQQY